MWGWNVGRHWWAVVAATAVVAVMLTAPAAQATVVDSGSVTTSAGCTVNWTFRADPSPQQPQKLRVDATAGCATNFVELSAVITDETANVPVAGDAATGGTTTIAVHAVYPYPKAGHVYRLSVWVNRAQLAQRRVVAPRPLPKAPPAQSLPYQQERRGSATCPLYTYARATSATTLVAGVDDVCHPYQYFRRDYVTVYSDPALLVPVATLAGGVEARYPVANVVGDPPPATPVVPGASYVLQYNYSVDAGDAPPPGCWAAHVYDGNRFPSPHPGYDCEWLVTLQVPLA